MDLNKLSTEKRIEWINDQLEVIREATSVLLRLEELGEAWIRRLKQSAKQAGK